MVHQILHGGSRIAGHRLTGILDEPVVAFSRTGDSLWPGIGRWLRHARQNCLGKSF
jgi:hypothetical protein